MYTSGVTLEGVRLQDMFLAGNTSRSASKHSVLAGRNETVISGRDLSSDKKVPQARRASEWNHRLLDQGMHDSTKLSGTFSKASCLQSAHLQSVTAQNL